MKEQQKGTLKKQLMKQINNLPDKGLIMLIKMLLMLIKMLLKMLIRIGKRIDSNRKLEIQNRTSQSLNNWNGKHTRGINSRLDHIEECIRDLENRKWKSIRTAKRETQFLK